VFEISKRIKFYLIDPLILFRRSPSDEKDAEARPPVIPPAPEDFFFCSFTKASKADILDPAESSNFRDEIGNFHSIQNGIKIQKLSDDVNACFPKLKRRSKFALFYIYR